MFDKDINIIMGNNSSGKTSLLRDIVRCLYNSNIIFLEIDGYISGFKIEKLRHLFLKVSNTESNLKSDLMTMDMIDEMVIKNKIDYYKSFLRKHGKIIFIEQLLTNDDYDFLKIVKYII